MNPNNSAHRSHYWKLALPLALACVAWLLYLRNAGLHPTVFADEWYYSKMSRLQPLSEAIVPSYLYLWIFSASKVCGTGFLECVRIGNLVFLFGAAPFVYLIARRYTGRLLACGVTLLSTLAPLNVYTAYFMPEVTYYFGFCVLSYLALRGASWHPALHAAACGAIVGLMSLVKVHALFLLPSFCLFLLYASWQRDGAWFLRGIAMAVIAVLSTLACKFGLGWALAGDAGLSLFGPFYGEATHIRKAPLELLASALVGARGHLMAMALLYGLPLAILVHGICTRGWRVRGDARSQLHLYVLLMLAAPAALTVLYTASLAAPGSHEGLRLHMRYYSFVFPLIFLVAAAEIAPARNASAQEPALAWLRWLMAAFIGTVVVFAFFKLGGFAMNVVDGPDISGIDLASLPFRALVCLQLLLVLAWAAKLRAAPLLFLTIALPASFAASHQGSYAHLAARRPPSQSDLAGKFLHDTVPPSERGQIVVAGTDMNEIQRVQFHIDHRDSTAIQYDFVGPLAEYQLPLSKKWIVLLGAYSLPEGVVPVLRTPHYVVARLPDPEPVVHRLSLADAPDPRVVTGFEGLSSAEPWGRWSDAGKVVIHFAEPLPSRVGVVLNARAFDLNTKLPFKARIGGQSREFRLGWGMQEIGLHFDTQGDARTLVIDVPHPVSPAELGQPGDSRKLGIGISEILITDGTRQAGNTP